MIIEENGFTRGQLTLTYNSLIEKDHVIIQVPAPGTMITRGSQVDMLVSLGPKPVKYVMPDLSDSPFDRAALLIERTSLTVGNVRSSFDEKKDRNSIIRQEPLAGYSVRANSPVDLVINRPSGETDGHRLHRPLYGSLLQHRIESGFLKKRVRVELMNAVSSTDLFDDYIKPGENIWVLVPREYDATVHIFEDEDLVRTRLYEAW